MSHGGIFASIVLRYPVPSALIGAWIIQQGQAHGSSAAGTFRIVGRRIRPPTARPTVHGGERFRHPSRSCASIEPSIVCACDYGVPKRPMLEGAYLKLCVQGAYSL